MKVTALESRIFLDILIDIVVKPLVGDGTRHAPDIRAGTRTRWTHGIELNDADAYHSCTLSTLGASLSAPHFGDNRVIPGARGIDRST